MTVMSEQHFSATDATSGIGKAKLHRSHILQSTCTWQQHSRLQWDFLWQHLTQAWIIKVLINRLQTCCSCGFISIKDSCWRFPIVLSAWVLCSLMAKGEGWACAAVPHPCTAHKPRHQAKHRLASSLTELKWQKKEWKGSKKKQNPHLRTELSLHNPTPFQTPDERNAWLCLCSCSPACTGPARPQEGTAAATFPSPHCADGARGRGVGRATPGSAWTWCAQSSEWTQTRII